MPTVYEKKITVAMIGIGVGIGDGIVRQAFLGPLVGDGPTNGDGRRKEGQERRDRLIDDWSMPLPVSLRDFYYTGDECMEVRQNLGKITTTDKGLVKHCLTVS